MADITDMATDIPITDTDITEDERGPLNLTLTQMLITEDITDGEDMADTGDIMVDIEDITGDKCSEDQVTRKNQTKKKSQKSLNM